MPDYEILPSDVHPGLLFVSRRDWAILCTDYSFNDGRPPHATIWYFDTRNEAEQALAAALLMQEELR